MLANGNVMMFDNGPRARAWSRVVEVDPRKNAIVWEYRAGEPADFYSKALGTSQALPNGNVLVGYSGKGQAFEVSRDGEVVWRYLNPTRCPNGGRSMLRIERYDPAFVGKMLVR
jgi:hypothetical protein